MISEIQMQHILRSILVQEEEEERRWTIDIIPLLIKGNNRSTSSTRITMEIRISLVLPCRLTTRGPTFVRCKPAPLEEAFFQLESKAT